MTNLQQRKRDVRSPSAARARSLSVVAGRRRRGTELKARCGSRSVVSVISGAAAVSLSSPARCESRSVVSVISGAAAVSLSSLISSSDPLMHGCGEKTQRAPAAFLVVVRLTPWSLRPTFLLRCNQGASGDERVARWKGRESWSAFRGVIVFISQKPLFSSTRVWYPRMNHSRTNHPNSTLLYLLTLTQALYANRHTHRKPIRVNDRPPLVVITNLPICNTKRNSNSFPLISL